MAFDREKRPSSTMCGLGKTTEPRAVSASSVTTRIRFPSWRQQETARARVADLHVNEQYLERPIDQYQHPADLIIHLQHVFYMFDSISVYLVALSSLI